ncbi:MAG TPA: VOC family protein [Allosphingosinicella sp.]|nr:VOC family protein [Allosphingosinicella sp.]
MFQKLAYFGLGVSDVQAWVRFGVEALGLQRVEAPGTVRLRMDDRSWRFAVHESPADDLAYAGFELESEAELAAFRNRLQDAKIDWTELDAAECADRQVGAGLWLLDPDGLRLEFVRDHASAATPFHSDLVEGFLTGEQGLGHFVIGVRDIEEGTRFYQALGFRLSDYITVPMGPGGQLRIVFMHCNPRHHSLAFAQLPGAKRLNHVMVELSEIDDVVRGHQRCAAMGYRPNALGRHPNDLMLSFYVTSPAGFDVEYGWGGRAIEGEWQIAEYDRISLWGHDRAA